MLSACSVVYRCYMSCGLCVRQRGQQKQTNFTGTYVQNRPHTENPGKACYPLPPEKKKLESPPRELLCSDRAQTSTTSSGRPSCVDVVFGFWLKVLVRRTKFQNRRKFHKYVYTYIDMLKHQTFGVIFRGKARAALTGDAQKCGLSYNTCTKCQGLTLKKRRRLRTGRQF